MAIEIDGLPTLKMVDLSMAMLVITRGYGYFNFSSFSPSR
jgi:hypothetical protein